MFSLYYGQILCVFVLVALAANGNANIDPQHDEELAATASVAAGITNVTSLNNRFADLSVSHVSIRRRRLTVNQVALGSINAVKCEAIKDCDQYITSYTFIDTEYEDDPIRIHVDAAAGSPEQQLVRCNLLYAIKTLAINLMAQDRGYGARFTESFRGQLLYIGLFVNKNDVPLLAQSSNSSAADPNATVAQEKRALGTESLDVTNTTTTFFTIPGSNDVEYKVEFEFRGDRVRKIGIFSAILEMMMTLAQLDSSDPVERVSQATLTDSSWIFVMHNTESDVPLQGFQLLAILESIARYTVSQARYQELTVNFFINRELVAGGCVTLPVASRAWCRG